MIYLYFPSATPYQFFIVFTKDFLEYRLSISECAFLTSSIRRSGVFRRLAIALWGNDSTSEIKDGFGDRETITWIRTKHNYNIELKPTYRAGGNNWQANGIAIIEKLSVTNK